MVRKKANIHRLLERRLGLWLQGNVEMLIQEAKHCNQALHWSWHSVVDDETVTRIFTKLMLHGKVKAAICWAIERTRGYVLSPSDLLDESFITTVMDILCQKHPAPSSDFLSLLKCKPLPHLEDVEKVMCYVLHVGLMVVLVQVVVIPATDLVFYASWCTQCIAVRCYCSSFL